MSERRVRVRFAPSPTGALHIGGVRTALYNYLFARQHGGDLVFRIEDTDSSRFVPGAEDYIIESFRWLGIKFDEGVSFGGEYGPYRQSERRDIYKKYVEQLLAAGKAYIAFDTPQELEAKRAEIKNFQYDASTRGMMRNSLTLPKEQVDAMIAEGQQYVVRFKIEPSEEVHVHDLIRGEVVVKSEILDDKVLYKSADELPTYHLANIVDDHLMEISHVIRGEEWLPSAPLHVLLYRAFGWEDTMPQFAHLPLLLKPDGKGKLSKRDGDRLGFPVFPLEWHDPKTGEVSNARGRHQLPGALRLESRHGARDVHLAAACRGFRYLQVFQGRCQVRLSERYLVQSRIYPAEERRRDSPALCAHRGQQWSGGIVGARHRGSPHDERPRQLRQGTLAPLLVLLHSAYGIRREDCQEALEGRLRQGARRTLRGASGH